MTSSYKLPSVGVGTVRPALEASQTNRPAREQAAPALFRLLSESALYRAVFAACEVPLGIVDARAPRPQFVQVNRAFERGFGFHAADACRYSVAVLLLNGDLGMERRLFRASPSRAEVAVRRRDGKCVPMVVSIEPLVDADGQLTHWAVCFTGQSRAVDSLDDSLGGAPVPP